MKALLLSIVKAMVDYPEEVAVNEFEGETSVVYELSVAKVDLGKVIGSKGNNINAIRTIVSAAKARHRKRAVIQLLE